MIAIENFPEARRHNIKVDVQYDVRELRGGLANQDLFLGEEFTTHGKPGTTHAADPVPRGQTAGSRPGQPRETFLEIRSFEAA